MLNARNIFRLTYLNYVIFPLPFKNRKNGTNYLSGTAGQTDFLEEEE